MRIPYELEKFLFYGFLQCLDAFCHVFTFLPIRIVVSSHCDDSTMRAPSVLDDLLRVDFTRKAMDKC